MALFAALTKVFFHVSKGSSCGPAQIEQGPVLVQQDPAYRCQRAILRIISEIVINANSGSCLSLLRRACQTNHGIGDQESKFLMSTLGISHAHSSLRTTGH